MSTEREAFLAGERPADVHVFLHEESVSDADALAEHGERLEDGVVLVVGGDQARAAFQRATGLDPMSLAREAMGTDGEVDPDCAGGTCPACGSTDVRVVFAFAEERNAEAGGLYAEGAVIHAYVVCECGERYSEKWVAGER